MKICFFAPANSAHTIKWCQYFLAKGHQLHVVSFTEGEIDGVTVHVLGENALSAGSDLQKLKYFTYFSKAKKIINSISPDIINVHYATSYGAVAALAGLKNYILSVWGSDIFEFPKKSPLHRALLKYSLKKAKYLFSTSQAMAKEAAKYTKKEFSITPFGVKTELFSPLKKSRTDDGKFVIGTVKSLAPAYGIDVLLKGAALVHSAHPEIPLSIRIAGKGPNEAEYKELAASLGIDTITDWLGFISQEKAAEEWANMDTAVICSYSESFGVSAVEAQACGCPVIITEVAGLMEATAPNSSSVVIPIGDERALADTIVSLYNDTAKREQMGMEGVRYVAEHYEYSACFEKIEGLFEIIINKQEGR